MSDVIVAIFSTLMGVAFIAALIALYFCPTIIATPISVESRQIGSTGRGQACRSRNLGSLCG